MSLVRYLGYLRLGTNNHRRGHIGLLGSAYIIVSAILVVPLSQWACTVLAVVIAPGEAPLSVVCGKHRRWRLCASSSSLSLSTPPPRDAHREDEGRPPLEGKTATTPSALSNESVELTTRCSTKTLMRLAQTGAIAKVARRTALRNLMASRDNSHSDPAGSEPQST